LLGLSGCCVFWVVGTKTEHESTTQKQTKNIPYNGIHILLKTDLQRAKDKEHRVKTEKWRWSWRISEITIKI